MIAITFALPTESAATAALLTKRQREKIDDRLIISGELSGCAVSLVHTGVGPSICRETMQSFLKANRPTSLIASGFAGAVRGDLKVGDLVFAENFSDPPLLLRARATLGDRASVCQLHSADRIIDATAERTALARAHGADVVDMETVTIAEACATALVPMLGLRIISDTPDEPFPLPPAVLFDTTRQRSDILKLGGHLLRRPAMAPKLLRFGRRMKEASSHLARALEELVREMP